MSIIAQAKTSSLFRSLFDMHKPITAGRIEPAIWETGVGSHTLSALVLLVANAVADHHPFHAGHLLPGMVTSHLSRPGKQHLRTLQRMTILILRRAMILRRGG